GERTPLPGGYPELGEGRRRLAMNDQDNGQQDAQAEQQQVGPGTQALAQGITQSGFTQQMQTDEQSKSECQCCQWNGPSASRGAFCAVEVWHGSGHSGHGGAAQDTAKAAARTSVECRQERGCLWGKK